MSVATAGSIPQTRRRPVKPGKVLGKALFYLLVVIILAYILFPFYWAARTSFMPDSDIYLTPVQYWPKNFTVQHYINAFSEPTFVRAIANSALIGVAATILSVLFGASASYALARFNFLGRNVALYLILAMSMFPGISILGALYTVLQKFHLYNTLYALIIVYLTFSLPLMVWIMQSFFRGMPRDLEEAAYVDGASQFQTFWRIMMPLAAPGLATAGILTLMGCWQEFLFALSFELSSSHWTVPLAIVNTGSTNASAFQIPWGDQMAETLVVMIPLIAVVLLLQRRIISGLTAGAVKG
ncbi:MAG: sugar ABC transporter permease [Candidatus Nephthysia bennettiae]|uniref:Carbohydrate ABC transporter permease n=1 Tax=Candidatus Nephthysia bennettiae TaxID=3127016 RepID=A0A934NC02_9BACT|nr:carbohydrate ABC transporter permease [Candidatus Dormibacteraeota bacterium]MBJ7614821.1 carbohydrate ABC transporter permease [Candidatus Dormibacteraeota bacterium]PZR84946.1 MAG: sugar ABC transporter permease [Candidatus Dormibacteraeota bacterium]